MQVVYLERFPRTQLFRSGNMNNKEKMPINGILTGILLLYTSGEKSCCDPLKNYIDSMTYSWPT